ncbi:uncharacterized protein HMPREF1541_10684 [Cyphellophora europaea CBS 101466]|uniref:Uncharacterized protein n=1 Tax=Cyphellophora europaea (strain CBS 101466) TaxID=1220924 RepID=W2S870_CYPE1|nr:uncharacterized protein HMPREF1541_10684 [Cyphellophora europaea CBS 101466]ETN44134.1 hypothetical protein HMPREF1541_10684 [Cyphellophora europaea CBS 101466]
MAASLDRVDQTDVFTPISVDESHHLVGNFTEHTRYFEYGTGNSTSRDTTVRIWAGMNVPGSDTGQGRTQGKVPMVTLYDERGQVIGKSCKAQPFILGDSWIDPVIHTWKGAKIDRPAYVQLSQTDVDALCISAIEIIYPDDGSALIYGDIPHKTCGWLGYPSVSKVNPREGRPDLRNPNATTGYPASCFWLGGRSPPPKHEVFNPSKHMAASVAFHIRDFDGKNESVQAYNRNTDLLCKSTPRMQAHSSIPDSIAIFSPPLMYGHEERFANGSTAVPSYLDPMYVVDTEVFDHSAMAAWPQSDSYSDANSKACDPSVKLARAGDDDDPTPQNYDDDTDKAPLSQLFANYLVISAGESLLHSAEAVCANSNILGPNYWNSFEELFCETQTRTLWHGCNGTENVGGCFDGAQMALLGPHAAGHLVEHSKGNNGNGSVSMAAVAAVAAAAAAPVLKKFMHCRHIV